MLPFDAGFIRAQFAKMGKTLNNPILDTLELSRSLYPHLKSHKLNVVAKHLNVNLINHHRAVDDAKATSEIFIKSMELMRNSGIKDSF